MQIITLYKQHHNGTWIPIRTVEQAIAQKLLQLFQKHNPNARFKIDN